MTQERNSHSFRLGLPMVALLLACESPGGSLHELSRVSFDEGFDVDGARPAAAGGGYVVWSTGDRRIIVLDSALNIRSTVATQGQPIGAWISGDTIEYFERGPFAHRVRIGEQDAVVTRLSPEWSRELVHSAVRLGPRAWLFVVEDSSSRHRAILLAIDQASAADLTAARELFATDSNPAQGLRMAYHSRGAVVTEVRPPYRSFIVGAGGAVEALGTVALERVGVTVAPKDSLRWIAMPPVAVVGGFLQVVSDLHDDSRIVATLGEDGELRRFRRVNLPIGLLTASGDRVLAVARLNSRVLIDYELRSR